MSEIFDLLNRDVASYVGSSSWAVPNFLIPSN